MRLLGRGIVVGLVWLLACQAPGAQAQTDPAAVFWTRLMDLCGHAYEAPLQRAPNGLEGRPIIHIYSCEPERVTMRAMWSPYPLLRTITLAKHQDGRLELRHDYLRTDGTPWPVTGHGGFTTHQGTEWAQVFPSDRETVRRWPQFWREVFVLEIHPGERFVYGVHAVGQQPGRSTPTEYDLTNAVPPPPDSLWERAMAGQVGQP